MYSNGREARSTAGDRLSFAGNCLYSYRSILARTNGVKGERNIFIYTDTVNTSRTSGKHASILQRTIPPYYNVFHVPGDNVSKNMINYVEEIEELILKQSRARLQDYSRVIKETIDEALLYSEIKKTRRTKEYKKILKMKHSMNNNDFIDKSASKIKEEKEKRRKRKFIESKKRHQKLRDKFLGDETYEVKDTDFGVLIKKVGSKLKTSTSVIVDFNEALEMYNKYISGTLNNGDMLGHFKVVRILKDRVIIGCTTISKKELDRVFKNREEKA
jgi:hypothetical protein